jgi:hypothetical protein
LPSHVTLHEIPPHWMPASQASVPTQAMSQLVASVQSTTPFSQARVPMQLTSHGRPAGQVTPLLHWLAPQSITQVPSGRQLVQTPGQLAASGELEASGAVDASGDVPSGAGPSGGIAPSESAASSDPDAPSLAPSDGRN